MECPTGIAYGNFLIDSCVVWLEDLMKAPIPFKPLRSYLWFSEFQESGSRRQGLSLTLTKLILLN